MSDSNNLSDAKTDLYTAEFQLMRGGGGVSHLCDAMRHIIDELELMKAEIQEIKNGC